MTDWALKRQLIILFLIFLLIFTIALVSYVSVSDDAPTCSDGVLNQGELRVDCGSVCNKTCLLENEGVSVLWSRSFKLDETTYSAAAYLRSLNRDLIAYNVPYQFVLYDVEGSVITQVGGSVDILPLTTTPIFVPTITVGNRVVVRTLFEFLETPKWIEYGTIPRFEISNETFDVSTNQPTATARVKNINETPEKDLLLVGSIFDLNNNAIATSQTLIKNINPEEIKEVFFSWRNPFDLLNADFCDAPVYTIIAMPQGFQETVDYAKILLPALQSKDKLYLTGDSRAVNNLSSTLDTPLYNSITYKKGDTSLPIDLQIEDTLSQIEEKANILIITNENLTIEQTDNIIEIADREETRVFLVFLISQNLRQTQAIGSRLPIANVSYIFDEKIAKQVYSSFQKESCFVPPARIQITPVPNVR